jgi:hypothetical protein
MKVSKAATIWIDYHKAHSKKKRSNRINLSLIGSAWILGTVYRNVYVYMHYYRSR